MAPAAHEGVAVPQYSTGARGQVEHDPVMVSLQSAMTKCGLPQTTLIKIAVERDRSDRYISLVIIEADFEK